MSDYTELERLLLHEQKRLLAFCEMFPTIANQLFHPTENFKQLNIVVGKHGDFLCIAKRFTGEEADEVLFASGPDPMKALFQMDEAISKGRWREEKPWSPPSQEGIKASKNSKG